MRDFGLGLTLCVGRFVGWFCCVSLGVCVRLVLLLVVCYAGCFAGWWCVLVVLVYYWCGVFFVLLVEFGWLVDM